MISLSGFGVGVTLASQNEFESILLSAIFRNNLRRRGVNSSLNVWQNSPVKSFGPGLLFVGSFLHYRFNLITGNWSVHIFCFFRVRSQKIVHFCKLVHFFYVVLFFFFFFGIYLLLIVSYYLYFCGVSCNFAYFVPDFIDLGPLSFIPYESG